MIRSVVSDLMLALQTHEITPAEFADAVLLLRPAEAHLAVSALSCLWIHDEVLAAQRRHARNLCQHYRLIGLAIN